MEPTSQSRRLLPGLHRLLLRLRLRLHFLLSLLPRPPFSLVALKDVSLSLLFLWSALPPPPVRPHGRCHPPPLGPTPPPPLPPLPPPRPRLRRQCQVAVGPPVPTLARSFNLYVPDLVFFGRSASDAGDFSIASQAKCVAETMRRVGVERYSVAGISYRGYVAFRMATEAKGGEVDRVVILSSGVGASEEERREMAGREERDVAEILLSERPSHFATNECLITAIRRTRRDSNPRRWVPNDGEDGR